MVEWRVVPGYEGLYDVSSDGRVRSLGRWVSYENRKDRYFPPRTLKTPIDSTGYPYVQLFKDKKGVTFRVHQLMGAAFLDRSEHHTQVRHLNDCRTDNRIENLKWGTSADNHADKFRNGYTPTRPNHCKRNHPLTGENELVKLDGRRNCRECGRASSYLRYHNGGRRPTEEEYNQFFKEHGYRWLN